MTFIDLQGNEDKTYRVGFHFSFDVPRQRMASAWPASQEENLERLKDAGLPFDRGVPYCLRCKGKSSVLLPNSRSCWLTKSQNLAIHPRGVPRKKLPLIRFKSCV